MQKKNIAWTLLILFVPALIVWGCSDGEDESDEIPGPVSKTVTAAEGGSVALDDGSAKVTIPADALSEDTEITIETHAKADYDTDGILGSNVFEFGPDGLQFNQAVTLELAFSGSVPEGKKALLGVYENDAWQPVEGSSLSGNTVSGPVMHFSLYAIVFVDGNAVITTLDEMCRDLDFSPCGGDLVASWAIQGLCYQAEVSNDENPFTDIPECSDYRLLADVDWQGGIEFLSDNTYTADMTYDMDVIVEVSETCLLKLRDKYEEIPADTAPADLCTMIAEMNGGTDVGAEALFENELCTITTPTKEGEPAGPGTAGTWSVEGNTATMISDDQNYGAIYAFCIEDDQLIFEIPEPKEDEGYNYHHLVLEKK